MKKILEVEICGHKILEYYDEYEQVWEYYFDDKYAFGVKDRFTVDGLIALYRNKYFDPMLDKMLEEE